jgi:hypothetical protein
VAATISSVLSTLEDAFHDELKAAFAAFCLNMASTDDIEDASQKFGRRLVNIKLAYQRVNAIAKTEFDA